MLRVLGQVDALTEKGYGDTNLMRRKLGDPQWHLVQLHWSATRMCVIQEDEPIIMAMGPDGNLVEGGSAGPKESFIDKGANGPTKKGALRDMRVIGSHVYIAGMSRQVYRRKGPCVWEHCDKGAIQPKGSFDAVGFNAIDGLREDEIYAVGFGGEIWRCAKDVWAQEESPTGLVLHRVCVASKSAVYAAGQQGVVLKRVKGKWKIIEHGLTTQDMWGMAFFKGYLYLAGDEGIFRLDSRDCLEPIATGLGKGVAYAHLHANSELLLSSGPKHVAYTEDGVSWHDVTP